jgi:arylsulfatase A-like enzyme
MTTLLLAVLAQQGVVLILSDAPVELKDGIALGRFYAASPAGSAARAGLLTGSYPARHRVNFELQAPPGNAAYQQDDRLDPRAPFLARLFKEAGYATGHAGPWRLAPPKDRPAFADYGTEEVEPLDFLRKHKDRPFFLCVATDEPKKILDVLDARVLVAVTRDSPAAGELRGQGYSLYEGGIRVPFAARGPGLAAGRDDTSIVGAIDLLPTLAALAGLKAPEGLDGLDRSAVLRGTSSPRPAPLFWEYGRGPNYPKPRVVHHRSPGLAALEGNWKLLLEVRGGPAELYDLSVDPGEEKDVAARQPELVARLKARALAWRMSLP